MHTNKIETLQKMAGIAIQILAKSRESEIHRFKNVHFDYSIINETRQVKMYQELNYVGLLKLTMFDSVRRPNSLLTCGFQSSKNMIERDKTPCKFDLCKMNKVVKSSSFSRS